MSSNTQKNEGRDKLTAEIERLESVDYGAAKKKLPTVKLQETEYDAPSDGELKLAAESALYDYRTDGERAIRDKSAASAAELAARRDALTASNDGEKRELDERYRAASDAIDSDVIRRGLARSSVATAAKGDLQTEYLKRSADMTADYGKRIADIDAEIAGLDAKLRTALDDFNLAYAAKLNEKLYSLKSERDKRVDEATKYNNEVRKSQAKLDADRAETESKLYTAALAQERAENNLSGLPADRRDDIYKAVFKQMDDFLSGMSEQEAKIELLNHSFYRQHLSNYYYNRLLDKYGR